MCRLISQGIKPGIPLPLAFIPNKSLAYIPTKCNSYLHCIAFIVKMVDNLLVPAGFSSSKWLLLFVVANCFRACNNCVATSNVVTPVTTTLATTTTTAAATTTTPAATTTTTPATTTTTTPSTTTTSTTTTTTTTTNPCAQCSLNTITLTPGDNVNTVTPTTPGVVCCDAMGCSSLTVTCTALAGGQVFMQFNVNQGGPLNPIGTVVTALLNCNAMGQWEFRPGMGLPNRVIFEVNCVLAGGG